MNLEDIKMYGKSIHTIDYKSRIALPAKFKITEGTDFGIINENNNFCRAYLYDKLVQILESLQKGSYSSTNVEENKRILNKVCELLLKIDFPKKVDSMGRLLVPHELATTCDGFPTYCGNENIKNRVTVIGEGLGFAIITNEPTLCEYASGKYGCNIESFIRKKD